MSPGKGNKGRCNYFWSRRTSKAPPMRSLPHWDKYKTLIWACLWEWLGVVSVVSFSIGCWVYPFIYPSCTPFVWHPSTQPQILIEVFVSDIWNMDDRNRKTIHWSILNSIFCKLEQSTILGTHFGQFAHNYKANSIEMGHEAPWALSLLEPFISPARIISSFRLTFFMLRFAHPKSGNLILKIAHLRIYSAYLSRLIWQSIYFWSVWLINHSIWSLWVSSWFKLPLNHPSWSLAW